MKKFLTGMVGLVFLGLLVQGTVFAQRAMTGDRVLDSLLTRITLQERSDPEGFIVHLGRSQRVPEEEIRQAKIRFGLNAGDTYMATVLSRIFKTSVGNVAEEYVKNQGRGWGVMALNRGIKPGSLEFKEMKANARDSVFNMKSLAKAKINKQNRELKKERENARKNADKSRGKSQGKGKKK